MKTVFYFVIASVAILTTACSAKRTITRSGLPQMVPDTVLLVNNDGTVDLNMSIIVPPKSIRRHALLTLTPVVVGQNDILELPSIEINSSKFSDASYTIPRKMVKYGATITYRERFPYADWMANSNIYLRGMSVKSSGRDVVMDRMIARGVVSNKPEVQSCEPCPEPETCYKHKTVSVSKSGRAHFNYMINSAKIDPRLDENSQNLKAIEELLTSVLADTSKRIVSIVVVAESSPDGVYEKNLILARQRADELCNYILNNVKLFRVCMQDVDAMSYFEVMNNRGEQLKYHELLKERLVAGLKEFSGKSEVAGKSYDELAEIYDRIWTACSYMDGNLLDHLHICFELKDGKHWWELKCE
jgi:hypothetical protein